MFKFLCQSVIDEDYVFGKGGKKFEEECLGVLKDLRYPAVDTLSRTSIGAPGSPHQWPSLLAMLAWLVDLSDVSPPPFSFLFSIRVRLAASIPLLLPFPSGAHASLSFSTFDAPAQTKLDHLRSLRGLRAPSSRGDPSRRAYVRRPPSTRPHGQHVSKVG